VVAADPGDLATRLLPKFAAGWGAPGTAPRIATTPTASDLAALRAGPDSLLTPAEVARRLRLCTETVRRLCRRGELPHVRIVDYVRIRPADLAAFIFARRSGTRT
jgi:excisionase family DNA binding protein